ncbi:formimidoylglutamase [Planococcus sp. 1R117A]|uniref:formimidoylglutamase n=1 Tax=Planococcus sp. 1R117A TaxID=3447020 RepID=UPI003EDCA6D6
MYKLPKRHFWHGHIDSRTDRASFRFHQSVELLCSDEVPERSFSIIGFECDEGAKRSGGQTGAAEAPDQIRSHLADLPDHLGGRQLVDAGTVMQKGGDMEKAQRELGEHISNLLGRSATPIILGGGHETTYGHYWGARRFLGPDAKIGIISIDAYFDLQDAERPDSRTVFKQILETDSNAGYLVLGVQPLGNTRAIFNKAEQLGAQFVLAEDLALRDLQSTQNVIDAFCKNYDHVLVTFCMESLSSFYAPSIVDASPFGLEPVVVRQLLWHIVANKKVHSFDISEVNPTIDENGKTTKLAAYLVAEVMAAFH